MITLESGLLSQFFELVEDKLPKDIQEQLTADIEDDYLVLRDANGVNRAQVNIGGRL